MRLKTKILFKKEIGYYIQIPEHLIKSGMLWTEYDFDIKESGL